MEGNGSGNAMVALNANWLDSPGRDWTSTGTEMDTANISITYATCYNCNAHPCICWRNWTVQYWPYPSPAKIRLKLSEVDVLRKAAKADTKLRAVLLKMTPYIEVEVDL